MGRYVLQDQDVLYFGVMQPNKPFEKSIILKTYTAADCNSDGSITIRLDPEDTRYLFPGEYYYSIKLNRIKESIDLDKVYTIIPKTKFMIID